MMPEEFGPYLAPKLHPDLLHQVQVLEMLRRQPQARLSRSDLSRFMIATLNNQLGGPLVETNSSTLPAPADAESSLSGLRLTSRGESLITKLEQLRQPGPLHSESIRKDLLAWSYDHYDEWKTIQEFLETDWAIFHGKRYARKEVEKAIARLEEDGLFRTSKAAGLDIKLVTPTSKGLQTVENGSEPRREPESGQQYITHITGNGSNIAIGSSHTTQKASVSINTAENIERIVDAVRQSLGPLALEGVDRSALERHLATAATLNVTGDPHSFRRVVEQLRDTIVAGAGGALGSVLVQQLTDAAAALSANQ